VNTPSVEQKLGNSTQKPQIEDLDLNKPDCYNFRYFSDVLWN